MRIYPGQASAIARDLIDLLLKDDLVELIEGHRADAELDLESVIREYIRTDREINDEAREVTRQRGLGNNAFGRIKRRLARDRGFGIGDDAIEWIVTQLTEMLLYSSNIDEIYADDRELRRYINKALKLHANLETELDREVRGKLKNLEEGSNAWDLEYEEAMKALKRNKGLV